jgi:rhamnosyltransferase
VQIVVRDDGSTDETLSVLNRFADERRVTLQRAAEPSGSAAQNFLSLIRQNDAKGFAFVAFADQDDIWYANKLHRACDRLISTGAAGYSSATLAVWGDRRTRLMKLGGRQRSHDFLFEGAGQGCTFVVTAEFYGRARNFLSGHWELTAGIHFHDWGLYALARAWHLQWEFDPVPSLLYRQHQRNDTGARGSARGVMRRFARIRSGWYADQLRRICALCSSAAPSSRCIGAWRALLNEAPSWRRQARLALFCLRGARRRRSDRLVLAFASLCRWL